MQAQSSCGTGFICPRVSWLDDVEKLGAQPAVNL